jgi:polysaccharide pyruvyl transferase WcaK-like protein
MTLRIHHYHPMGTRNSGDDLVVRALRQALTRRLGACAFTSIPAVERGLERGVAHGLCLENVQRSNREADLIVVGGSNMLEPRKARHGEDCNIPLHLETEALRRLEKPLLLAGMGTGSSFGKRIKKYSAKAQANLRLLFSIAGTHAVRDVTTQRCLAEIGVATECTGCPVTFLTDRAVAAQDESRPLLVSFPPGRIVQRFLGARFMRLAMKYVAWLKSEGVPLIVTMHEASDQSVIKNWLPSGTEVFFTEDLNDLVCRFEESRGVIGFRLHAGLLGLGLGKPIIPVGVDWRGLAFIETGNLHDLSVRPFRLFQLAKLKRLTRLLLDQDSGFLKRLNDVKQSLRTRHEAFFDRAVARFRRRAQAG